MKRYLMTALCCAWIASGVANHATLVNTSGTGRPLTVVYRTAFKNPERAVVFGPMQTIPLGNQKRNIIPFEMNGYQRAGIVLVSIDGHALPEGVNAFDQPRQCSLTTDREHTAGVLTITYHDSQGHKELTCAVQGGIFG